MSHAIYQTQALILKTKNMRESNKLVYLYTQKFGLIYASMQSLRELKSKMRYHVHPYSLVDVDLVSGRNIWRITGIHEKESAFDLVDTPWYRLVSLVSDTLIRLCVGEEQNQILWENVALFLDNLKGNEEHKNEYEIIMMVRILHALGYWNEDDAFLIEANPYRDEIFSQVRKNSMEYITKINNSLHDSQL